MAPMEQGESREKPRSSFPSKRRFERDCMKNIREAGYGHFIEEFTSPEQIIEKFPQFQKAVENGFNTAYLNKEGGMLS